MREHKPTCHIITAKPETLYPACTCDFPPTAPPPAPDALELPYDKELARLRAIPVDKRTESDEREIRSLYDKRWGYQEGYTIARAQLAKVQARADTLVAGATLLQRLLKESRERAEKAEALLEEAVAKDYAPDDRGEFCLYCDVSRSGYPDKPFPHNDRCLIRRIAAHLAAADDGAPESPDAK